MRNLFSIFPRVGLRTLALSLAWTGCALVAADAAAAPVRRVDDAGRAVVLKTPARRIVSLSPGITELLFAAGAGAYVVGTTRYSDYPDAAKRIAQIGDATSLDLERILALRPDLIVIWRSGTSPAMTAKLTALGVPVYFSEPVRLRDIPETIAAFGALAGTGAEAGRAAREFREDAGRLRRAYAGRTPVTVFYQVWEQPLMTIGGKQLINDAIVLCGGVNVFATLAAPAPTIGPEAVVAANPQAIVTTTYAGQASDGLDRWRKLRNLRATAQGHLFALETPTLSRQSPRTLEGVELLCRALDRARGRRP